MIERELDLVNQALAAASQLTGLQFTAEQAASLDDVRFGQMITFHGQGGKVRYAVEVVSKLTNANLGPVATRVRNLGTAGLLIAPYVNRNLAEKLKALNIPSLTQQATCSSNDHPQFSSVVDKTPPGNQASPMARRSTP